jgi:DNA-binding protein HU-beta
MTKTDLIDRVAERTRRTKKEAEEVVESVLACIAGSLASGENVDLRGFGSFQVSEKPERQGRNPRTGEALTIAARRVAGFKPGKELAERVNSATGSSARETELDTVPHAEQSSGPTKVHGDKIS